MAATSAPQPVSPAASGPAAWPPHDDPGGGRERHVTPRFPPEPAPQSPSVRFPADPASAPTPLPRSADSPAGAPGSAAFQAPRRAEELWPALPDLPALPALSPGTDTQPLGDGTEHLARLDREQEGF
ncbi:MAG: hypothetical protein KY462_08975 [Actinobacteria bacterium]|nr:hypothetical protein [Actinomycetota bacterium]